jgi:hypothetical protein
MIKVGTPVIYFSKNCIVTRAAYSARFITAEDRSLIDSGMGHLAGSYGTAYDLYCIDNGLEYKKCSSRSVRIEHTK